LHERTRKRWGRGCGGASRNRTDSGAVLRCREIVIIRGLFPWKNRALFFLSEFSQKFSGCQLSWWMNEWIFIFIKSCKALLKNTP
jgi:hypothetical protein